jgi:hypothetical protein
MQAKGKEQIQWPAPEGNLDLMWYDNHALSLLTCFALKYGISSDLGLALDINPRPSV